MMLSRPFRVKGVIGASAQNRPVLGETVIAYCQRGAASLEPAEGQVISMEEQDVVWFVDREPVVVPLTVHWGVVWLFQIRDGRVRYRRRTPKEPGEWHVHTFEELKPAGYCDKLIADMWRYRQHPFAGSVVRSVTRLYLLLIHELLQRRSLEVEAKTEWPDPRFIQASTFIRSNLTTPLRKPDVAAHLGMSESGLTQLFARCCGLPCSELVFLYRSLRARLLLETTRVSVNDLGKQCGFGNSDYFIQAFRRWFGITPLQFRMHSTGKKTGKSMEALHALRGFDPSVWISPDENPEDPLSDEAGEPVTHVFFNRLPGTVILECREIQQRFILDPSTYEIVHDRAGSLWECLDAEHERLAWVKTSAGNTATLIWGGGLPSVSGGGTT